jgi:hypothetical protein
MENTNEQWYGLGILGNSQGNDRDGKWTLECERNLDRNLYAG